MVRLFRDSVEARMVALFLCAAVAANMAVSAYGQSALVFTAWVLIPFDLVTRDVLHEKWGKSGVWPRMIALIAAGGLLTWIVNLDAARVALASVLAFVCSATINALVYHACRNKSRLMRMNTSNALAAVADSIIFPVVAFELVDLALCGTQAMSKFFGGVFWSFLFVRLLWRKR